MTVILKDRTGDLTKLHNAEVELRPDMGILEVRYTDRKGSERMRTYILQNLVSYETFVPIPREDDEEEESVNDDSDVGE